MTDTPASQSSDTDMIDLTHVIAALRRRWAIIVACAIAAVIVCAIHLRSAPPVYQVQMKVAAVERAAYDSRHGETDERSEPREAKPHQTLSTAMVFTLYLESLQSRRVADVLAANPEVMKILFPRAWDGKALRQPLGGAHGLRGQVQSLLGWPAPAPPPPGAEVQRILLGAILVEQDSKKHAFATIRMRSAQPALAARFLMLLHQATEDRMRLIGLAQSRQRIAGLEALPGAGTDAATAQALGEERVVEAAALSGAPFAAQVLDDPAPLPDPVSSPFRTLAGALVLGIAAGVALALALHLAFAWRDRRRVSAQGTVALQAESEPLG